MAGEAALPVLPYPARAQPARRARRWRARLTTQGRLRIRSRLWNGAVAQLVERVVRNDEVSGSIPLGSTISL